MIVDLIRNDLGIVAETGSVKVDSLFEVETYPTVHQMTSTISAKLKKNTNLVEIFKAMFPCGSVTGAPKKRSMEIIAEIENVPRGVYCGAIGYVAPGGEALFSVAIRTLFFDKINSNIRMGVGSGITWDSEAASEYNECLNKGAFVHQQVCDFKLIESFRLENGVYYLFDRHIARLVASAKYFGFTYDTKKICSTLMKYADRAQSLCKVRLLLAADGSFDISSDVFIDSKETLAIATCDIRINSSDPLCYHKSTCRENFDSARTAYPDYDELIFLNENGQLTEGSYHNLVLKLNGALVTPQLTCGLLPGVLRAELIEEGTVTERILYPDELNRADEIWLINSVRGWRRAIII
jgi:para-aminobenzoate synthetase/4-amino-4-deoxychorismate lyase